LGFGDFPQQAETESSASGRNLFVLSLSDQEGIACYNMFDPKNGVALVMLFSGSNLSYNEEVIGLTGHCLS
jgi:hypothetical protein